MVVERKMNSASLPPLRPDSEQLVDLHVYYLPPEIWNSTYKSVYNDVINEAISIGFVRVWPELSLWNLRGELLNQLGPDSVPGEFVYVRSVGRCLTQVKGRQELELKVKAFLPPKNYAPEIFVLDGPQDVPDTALIEASKGKEEEASMEVDEDGDKDGREETDVLGKLPHYLPQRLQGPTANLTPNGTSEHSVNAPKTQTNNSSPSSSGNLPFPTFQPRMASHPSSSLVSRFPSNSPRAPPHAQSSQPLPIPNSSQSRRFRTPSNAQTPQRHPLEPQIRQILHSRQRSDNLSRNQGALAGSDSGESSQPLREAPPSQEQSLLSNRTYSQTSQGTLPEFSSLSESSRSLTIQSHNSQGQSHTSHVGEEFVIDEDVSKIVGADSEDLKSSSRKELPNKLGRVAHPVNLEKSVVTSEIISSNLHELVDASRDPSGNHSVSGAAVLASQTVSNVLSFDGSLKQPVAVIQAPPNNAKTPNSVNPQNLNSPMTNHALPSSRTVDPSSNEGGSGVPLSPLLSSPARMHPLSDTEPHRTVTTRLVGKDSLDETLRKTGPGGRQETSANSDSGLEDQTPDEISERHHRDIQGSRGTFHGVANDRQTTYQVDEHQQDRRGHSNKVQENPEQGQYPTQNEEHFQESPRVYRDSQYYPSSTQRSMKYDEPPASDRQRAMAQEGDYNHGGPASARQVPMLPLEDLHEDRTPRGTYRQGLESDISPRENESRFGHPSQVGQSQRYQDRRYDPSESGPSSGFNEEAHDWQEDRGPLSREPSNNQALDTQQAMAYLQLSSNRQLSPKTYSRPSNSDSPLEEPSSALSTSNSEKRMILDEIGEEQQARLEMEKVREELIKKAKSLQGKTIDRRKKARDYWKKRYYDEKKKTPALEDQVSKLSGQVQQQNRKLMSHLEGKGARQPKGPPSKKMDHKIQIFKHQHNIDDLKRQVDNARMKLATEIKLRTQAEMELRILKTEVTQKKINVTLKRGKQLQPVQQTEDKFTSRGMRGTGRSGNSV